MDRKTNINKKEEELTYGKTKNNQIKTVLEFPASQ